MDVSAVKQIGVALIAGFGLSAALFWLSYATNSELLFCPQCVGFVVCIALRGVHSATKTDFAEIMIPINAAIYTGFVLVLLQVFWRADSK
jgi:hypothetical protein